MNISHPSKTCWLILIFLTAHHLSASENKPTTTNTYPLEDTAEQSVGKTFEVEAGLSYEKLNNKGEDTLGVWRSLYLEALTKFNPRSSLYGTLRQTDRFSLKDEEFSIGTYFPLGSQWIGTAEGAFSPSHRVLPRWYLMGQIQWLLGGGSVVHVGIRHIEFVNTSPNVGILTLEHYWNTYRGSYTLYASHVPGSGTGAGHRLWASYYYNELSAVNAALSIGKEVENVGPAGGVLTSTVRGVVLFGRHWFSKAWAFSYELTLHEQGIVYTRKGVHIGVRYHF